MTKSNYFKLKTTVSKFNTKIEMEMLVNILSTGRLPFTYEILETSLPGVLQTKCFNQNNLTFKEEVRDTEIAHLFEHILLQLIFQHKLAAGYKNIIIRGDTSWNWRKEKRGLFHIYLSANANDKVFFEKALDESITLINRIIDSYFYYPNEFNYTNPLPSSVPLT